MTEPDDNRPTLRHERDQPVLLLPQIRLVETTMGAAPREHVFEQDAVVLGAGAACDLVVADPMVSRRHCRIRRAEGTYLIEDCSSLNGTFLGGVRVTIGWLWNGCAIRLGDTSFTFCPGRARVEVAAAERFGELHSSHPKMRAVFGLAERIAKLDATVLLTGESGTGKELLARAIHAHSARAACPFIVFDCAAVAPGLLESELFGHERGSYTGAVSLRRGVFERARGGTLLLDEIGELPRAAQSRLLRVIETREVRRVGGAETSRVDVRLLAATHRTLTEEVAAGRFRADLQHRLGGLAIELPPLRQRKSDLPALCTELLARIAEEGGAKSRRAALEISDDALRVLRRRAFPGNLRELRNVLARAAALAEGARIEAADVQGGGGVAAGNAAADALEGRRQEPPGATFPEARKDVIASFEQEYLRAALARHRGNVTRAARESGLDRRFFRRLMVRHGITQPPRDSSELAL